MIDAPIVLATWNHGKPATERALAELTAGHSALDAAERGVMVVESECPDRSVGLQGWPDRDGIVTLDAAIMDDTGRSGAVACVRGVAHPIALARRVMDRTPHALLVGPGAEAFARSEGLHSGARPLDPEQERAWREWLRERQYIPRANSENHDTSAWWCVMHTAACRPAAPPADSRGRCMVASVIHHSSVRGSTWIPRPAPPSAPGWVKS